MWKIRVSFISKLRENDEMTFHETKKPNSSPHKEKKEKKKNTTMAQIIWDGSVLKFLVVDIVPHLSCVGTGLMATHNMRVKTILIVALFSAYIT